MDNLFSVAERFGTPCFVFDEVQLARRMKAVRAIVPEDIRLCYSIKANPFLIPAMRRLVGTLEVCSPGELEICRQQGVSPDMVLFSGVNKTRADVERAMDLGVTRFTCESPLHVRLIDEAARSRGRVYPVLLRLTAGSQFGMDERDFFAALDHRAATPGIRIEGVHYFSGTQRKKLDGQRKELAMLCALADRLMHPRREISKVYEVTARGPLDGVAERLRRPLVLDGYRIRPPEVEQTAPGRFLITIHEGRNRQIRRMCAAAGLEVLRLRRIAEGPLQLGTLAPGAWRPLTEAELAALRQETEGGDPV